MCLGVQCQRQADASVRGHASDLGAAQAEPEREQPFDADRRRQPEADQDPEGCGVIRRVEGRVRLEFPGAGPIEAVSVLRGERRAHGQLAHHSRVVGLICHAACGLQRLDVDAFVDGHLRGPAACRAAQQQPDVELFAVRVEAEPARGVVTRARAVHAGFHDGGQAGLAHDPQCLAVGIHRCGCFQGSAGALAGEAAAPGIWRMHNTARSPPGPGRQAPGPIA
jgi:hypothetical protein